MRTVIDVENVSKLYRLGQIGTGTIAHDFNRWILKVRGKEDPYLKIGEQNDRSKKGVSDYVWALKDIDFKVNQGEVMGIIGKNGAGKSTLLKILSRTTLPTTGQIKIKGRMASLLEVGTGFHPELSGRDNIYLNGAILGMKKAEIKKKFDEILDFSGVERYVDTPVKRYSSGMYVRLAFAVAAHLEPEILVVDEVLAVGDAEFQAKCLGKMKDISQHGRTVLFVSHNLNVIKQLCDRCVYLVNGTVDSIGLTQEITNKYINTTFGNATNRQDAVFAEDLKKDFQILSVAVTDSTSGQKDFYECEEDIYIRINCISRASLPGLYGYMNISGKDGDIIWESDSKDISPNIFDGIATGIHEVVVKIPRRTLAPGEYILYFNFTCPQSTKGHNIDSLGYTCSFKIIDSFTSRGNNRKGNFSHLLKWELIK